MTDRKVSDAKAQIFFEELWQSGGDPWELETSGFERAKYEKELEILQGRRYPRVLELGCAAGSFTQMLAPISDSIVAVDISPTAIARARLKNVNDSVDFRVENIMSYDPIVEGPWDLIVINETIYYIGWLYSFFDVVMLVSKLYSSSNRNGTLMIANTVGGVSDYLLRPVVIHSYRDLFLNAGYGLLCEEIFRGSKNGAQLEVMISLFLKTDEFNGVWNI